MLEAIKSFLQDLTSGLKHQERFEEDDYRLAAAALMVHVIGIDGEITEKERAMLHGVLRQRFELTEAQAEELAREAAEAEGEAVDLYRFTHLITRTLDEEGRRRIVEMLWEMSYADGQANEIEDNVLWRIADLLGVPSRERIALRRQVAEDLGGQDTGPQDAGPDAFAEPAIGKAGR